MISVSRAQLQERWEQVSETLRDEVCSDMYDETIETLVEQYTLNESQHKKLAYICLVVFLGFLDIKDVFEEIQKKVIVDAKTAMELYEAVKSKIFIHAQAEIIENYKRWTFGIIPKENISPLFTSEKITLKKEYTPGTIDLSLKDIPVMESKPSTSTPMSQSISQHEIQPTIPIVQPQDIQNTKEVPIASISAEKHVTTSTVQPTTQPISDVGPMILHKKEDINPIAQTTNEKGYRQMSFGSFMGSFKTPFTEKQKEVSRAQVEIPTDKDAKQIPFSVKKYEENAQPAEQAKVVHYKE